MRSTYFFFSWIQRAIVMWVDVQSILKPISFHNEYKFAFVTSESNDVYKKYIFLWCFCCLSHLKYRFCYNFRFLRNIVNQRDLMARPKKTKSISEIQNTKWIEKEETTKSIKPIMEKSIVVNGKKRKFKIHSAFRTMALCLWLGFCHVDGRKKRILAMCFVYQISFTCLKSHPKIVFLKLGFYLKMLHSYERHCFSFLHIFQVSSRFTFGLSRILFTFLVYSISPLASRLWCIIWNVCYLFKDVRLYIEMRTLSISFWIIVYAFCLDVFDCERFKCIKCTHCVHNQMNLLPKNFNKVTWIITSWLVLLKSIDHLAYSMWISLRDLNCSY